MKKIISGKTIYLRSLNINDVDNGWLNWINNEDVTKHMPYIIKKKRKDLIDYFNQNKLPKSKIFAICLLNNNKYIGNARLSSIDKKNGTASYGWFIGEKTYWGKGIGTEALNLLCVYAFEFLKVRKVFSGIMPDNIYSKKSTFRLGATLEGTWKDHVVVNGKTLDIELISILKKNFKKKYARKHWK